MFRKVIVTLGACCVVLGAAGCNTVKGVGRDIESVGNAGSRVIR